MKGQQVGSVNWHQISTVIEALDGCVPTLANGGVEVFEDLGRATCETGACGAMTSEAALEDPSVFDGSCEDGLRLAEDYLKLCDQHPPLLKFACGHVHKLLFRYLQAPGGEAFRARVGSANSIEGLGGRRGRAPGVVNERAVEAARTAGHGRRPWTSQKVTTRAGGLFGGCACVLCASHRSWSPTPGGGARACSLSGAPR